MSSLGAEQRRHPRYATELALEIRSDGGWMVTGRSRNMSRGGLCALLPKPLDVGSSVRAKMSLVFDAGTVSEPIEVSARVVWCTPLDDRFQVGLALDRPPPERAKFLDMFLRYLDEGQRAATADDRGGDSSKDDDPFA